MIKNAGTVAAVAAGLSLYAHPMALPLLAIAFSVVAFILGHRMGRVRGRHEEFVALWSKFEMIPLRKARNVSDIYVRPMSPEYAEQHSPNEDEF